jgi:hypothetical protein
MGVSAADIKIKVDRAAEYRTAGNIDENGDQERYATEFESENQVRIVQDSAITSVLSSDAQETLGYPPC